MTIAFRAPAECSADELNGFYRLIREGGEVQAEGLEGLVALAEALAFLRCNNEIVGIAALKKPRVRYRARIFKSAKAKSVAAEFPYELGWVFISEAHRGKGLSNKLVEATLTRSKGRNVFATSLRVRKAMHKTLDRCGFVRDGEPYQSSWRDEELLLFVRKAPALVV